MLESINYIDISENPLIESLDNKTFNEYFCILNSENNTNNSENNKKIDSENTEENFDKYSLEDIITNNKAINKSMRIKANNSKVIICKLHN